MNLNNFHISCEQCQSILYQRLWSIFRDNIHHPNILVFKSSCKWSHVCFHVHQVPKRVWLYLWTQEIPIIFHSMFPKFLHHTSNIHLSVCRYWKVHPHQAKPKQQARQNKCLRHIYKVSSITYCVLLKHFSWIAKISQSRRRRSQSSWPRSQTTPLNFMVIW